MGYRYGVLLQELAGKKVDFVDCWQPNVDAAQAQGGVTVSRDHEGRHLVPARVYTPEQYKGDPDVWIVMVKQMQLNDVLERCSKAGLFKDHQVVFSAMNGWGHFEKLQKYFKDENIYGGTAMVATVMNGPADVDFIGKPGAGAMRLVSMTGKKTLVEQQMFDDFKAANFNPSYGNDLKGTCMAKVIFNSVVNTLCTMYQIQMGQFIEYPGALASAPASSSSRIASTSSTTSSTSRAWRTRCTTPRCTRTSQRAARPRSTTSTATSQSSDARTTAPAGPTSS